MSGVSSQHQSDQTETSDTKGRYEITTLGNPMTHTYGMKPEVAGASPTVSVVIPAFSLERWELLKRAVESVRRQSRPVERIVVCIDNNAQLLRRAEAEWRGSADPRIAVLPNRHDEHLRGTAVHQRAHGTTRRFGAGSARNTAAEVIGSDIIAFMDDDAWAERDWIEQLAAVFDDGDIVAVGGVPLPEFETPSPKWFPQSFGWVYGCAYDGLPTSLAPLRHLIGSNMSVRREAFVAVGGFIGSDFDDLNLCMRLAERFGVSSLYYNPQAVVHHYVPRERVSWRYFWRRCYFVNREKVRVFRELGPAANLAAEREFVWRSLRRQAIADVRRGIKGEDGAFLAVGAMLAGIALAASGHVHGQIHQRIRVRRPS